MNDRGIRTPAATRGRALKYVSALILLLIVAGLVTSKAFMNKVSVRTFQMNIAPDGKVPWGEVGPEWENGPAPVVLYRQVGDSYCYTALRSPELRDRAIEKSLKSVTVDYNVFSDFGRARRYTLRTIDGVPFAIGDRVIRATEEFGAQVLMDSNNPSACF
jgi:hypothetical protein